MRFYTKTHTHYCGIDLHAKTMYLCILDKNGEILLHQNMQSRTEDFLVAAQPYRDDLVVAVECMFTWSWIADLCAREGYLPRPSMTSPSRRTSPPISSWSTTMTPSSGAWSSRSCVRQRSRSRRLRAAQDDPGHRQDPGTDDPLYEIHDIDRFPRVQDFASYCRPVKCQSSSVGTIKVRAARRWAMPI